jgi:hypothetical protein
VSLLMFLCRMKDNEEKGKGEKTTRDSARDGQVTYSAPFSSGTCQSSYREGLDWKQQHARHCGTSASKTRREDSECGARVKGDGDGNRRRTGAEAAVTAEAAGAGKEHHEFTIWYHTATPQRKRRSDVGQQASTPTPTKMNPPYIIFGGRIRQQSLEDYWKDRGWRALLAASCLRFAGYGAVVLCGSGCPALLRHQIRQWRARPVSMTCQPADRPAGPIVSIVRISNPIRGAKGAGLAEHSIREILARI